MPGKVLQVLLVDDDPSSREELKQHLAAIPDVSVVGEAGDTNAAILQLRSQPVDLVFLDIELGRDSGFRLASTSTPHFPPVWWSSSPAMWTSPWRAMSTVPWTF